MTAEDIVEYIAPLLQTCFRVVDDIKETVRKAAAVSLKALGKVCTFYVSQIAGCV